MLEISDVEKHGMPLSKILSDAESHMKKTVEFLKQEFRTVRTGRASTGLVENLKVEVASYGSTMSLRELATIGVTDGNTIVIKPFDPTTLKDIQRAVETSDLGINPQSDGKVLRLPVPTVSTERRNQLIAHIKQLSETQKVNVRNTRRDANKQLDAEKKDKTLTEDDVERGQTQVQKLTDQYVKQMDDLLAEKSNELMQV